jgi:hypothetical protein
MRSSMSSSRQASQQELPLTSTRTPCGRCRSPTVRSPYIPAELRHKFTESEKQDDLSESLIQVLYWMVTTT